MPHSFLVNQRKTLALFSLTLQLTHSLNLFDTLDCCYIHIFSKHYCPNLLQHSTLYLLAAFHMHPSLLTLFLSLALSFIKMYTNACKLQFAYVLCIQFSPPLGSSLVGEVRSVLANKRHRDLRPHPGNSAGYGGAGHLLCQDLRSLQGNLACAVDCKGACCVLIC